MRLPYSADIVPPGGHLFRSLQNPLNGINLVAVNGKTPESLVRIFRAEDTEVVQ